MKLTQEYLKECTVYYPVTGIFIWNDRPLYHFKDGKKFKAITICRRWNNMYANKQAGSLNKINNSVEFCINKNKYYAHRVAWLYMTGDWPKYVIDHIDGNPANNKFDNLRDVPQKINTRNNKIAKNNTSGVTGVWKSKKNIWWFEIKIDYKNKYLGTYKHFDDAVKARYNEEITNKLWQQPIERSSAYIYLKENNLL